MYLIALVNTCDFGAKNLDDFERLSDLVEILREREGERERECVCVIIEILKECDERVAQSLVLS